MARSSAAGVPETCSKQEFGRAVKTAVVGEASKSMRVSGPSLCQETSASEGERGEAAPYRDASTLQSGEVTSDAAMVFGKTCVKDGPRLLLLRVRSRLFCVVCE